MDLRFLVDSSGAAHIHAHGVTEPEVEQVLSDPLEDGQGDGGARVALGRTAGGRLLRVVYIPDADAASAFVITAYEPGAKPARALRRRLRRRR